MPIEHIHTYMVHPGKGAEPREISGSDVALNGNLFKLLEGIYSSDECDIDIAFVAAVGKQHNECRSLFTSYLDKPSITTGRKIAERLESVTTHRSKLGLLFIIAGKEGPNHKLVISRFPADSAIQADEDKKKLSVEFLERVFMKSSMAYKAVTYQHSSLKKGFWFGKATDKQAGNRAVDISGYWITEFLASDFRTTAAAGTKRLAVALRHAAQKATDLQIKQELSAAATLARNFGGDRMSVEGFAQRLHLSPPALEAILAELPSRAIAAEQFQFDAVEFAIQVKYRTVELDTGALLTAPSGDFDSVFTRTPAGDGRVRYTAEGHIQTEKLEKLR